MNVLLAEISLVVIEEVPVVCRQGIRIASFQARYAGEASFSITFQPQSESHCKDALLGDIEHGADVFAFADDQVAALAAAGGLDPIEDPEEIRAANLSAAVEAASVGSTLYAYPLTADNGYFLYYNKAYFSEEDVQSLDRMLEIALVIHWARRAAHSGDWEYAFTPISLQPEKEAICTGLPLQVYEGSLAAPAGQRVLSLLQQGLFQ